MSNCPNKFVKMTNFDKKAQPEIFCRAFWDKKRYNFLEGEFFCGRFCNSDKITLSRSRPAVQHGLADIGENLRVTVSYIRANHPDRLQMLAGKELPGKPTVSQFIALLAAGLKNGPPAQP